MKRVVSLVAALALAVGAFAPAAFASDAGYGQTDLIPLEDLDQETFDTYLSKFYSQDYPTYGILDLLRDSFQGGLSNASGLNDSPWSWALNLVDNASDLGTEIGLWMQGVKIDPNTGKVFYPDDYLTDYAKEQLDTQLKSTPGGSGTAVTIGSGTWISGEPFNYNSYSNQYVGSFQSSSGNACFYTVWGTQERYDKVYHIIACCVGNSTSSVTVYHSRPTPAGSTVASVNTPYTVDGNIVGYYGGMPVQFYENGTVGGVFFDLSNCYSSQQAALADFFGNSPSVDPVWNGSGYYSVHQEGFSINLPSLPSTNWGNLSKYYYNTYGDEIYEGDVDRYYYNIANNYVPYEVSYDLPYWLINGSTDILDFDYSLELPTAELSTLPADFEGGSNFWDNSFSMLAGFGSFIVLGLSFALVGLFFKD